MQNKIIAGFVLILILMVLFLSCVSSEPIKGIPMISKELETMEIVGFVETEFEPPGGSGWRAAVTIPHACNPTRTVVPCRL